MHLNIKATWRSHFKYLLLPKDRDGDADIKAGWSILSFGENTERAKKNIVLQ